MFFKSTGKPQSNFIHPLDPSVDREYDLLVLSWKNQLVQNTPQSPNVDYTRYAWIQLMDHYLDQQWLDSKQMLQCAQVWSSKESISVSEVVHIMKILSLKFMQRSLDTRKELLNTLSDPDIMMALGIPPRNEKGEEEEEEQEEQEEEEEDKKDHLQGNVFFHSTATGKEDKMPLSFMNGVFQKSTSFSHDDDGVLQKRGNLDESESIRESLFGEDIKKRSIFEEDTFGFQRCLRYSKSTPDFSLEINFQDNEDSQSTGSFKDVQGTRYRSDNSSSCSSTVSSQSEFFLHSRDGPNGDTTNFFTIRQSTLYKAGFADEKVETDSTFDEISASTNIYSNNKLCAPNQEQFDLATSQSSISIFEPNDSSIDQTGGLLSPNKRATIVKSRSFPTKEALSDIEDKKTANKERAFMLRSIVNKKPSFTRFFGVKKG